MNIEIDDRKGSFVSYLKYYSGRLYNPSEKLYLLNECKKYGNQYIISKYGVARSTLKGWKRSEEKLERQAVGSESYRSGYTCTYTDGEKLEVAKEAIKSGNKLALLKYTGINNWKRCLNIYGDEYFKEEEHRNIKSDNKPKYPGIIPLCAPSKREWKDLEGELMEEEVGIAEEALNYGKLKAVQVFDIPLCAVENIIIRYCRKHISLVKSYSNAYQEYRIMLDS